MRLPSRRLRHSAPCRSVRQIVPGMMAKTRSEKLRKPVDIFESEVVPIFEENPGIRPVGVF